MKCAPSLSFSMLYMALLYDVTWMCACIYSPFFFCGILCYNNVQLYTSSSSTLSYMFFFFYSSSKLWEERRQETKNKLSIPYTRLIVVSLLFGYLHRYILRINNNGTTRKKKYFLTLEPLLKSSHILLDSIENVSCPQITIVFLSNYK